MRIRHSNRRSYLTRRDQFRLLSLVAMIGLVIIAIDVARKPASWYWLTGAPGAQSTATDPKVRPASPKIDFRVNTDEDDDRLPPNVVVVVDPDREASDVIEPGGLQLTPDEIAQIKDNSVGIRASEWNLYYDLIARARDIPEKEIRKAARDDIAYPVLMSESEDFLGQPITVRGRLHWVNTYEAGPNDFGVETCHEAWMFTYDSGKNPYRVICTSIPRDIPIGRELPSETVASVTGFYFKRYGYPTADNRLHVAPLILAGRLNWIRPREITRHADAELVPWILGAVSVFAVAIGITLWRFRMSDRRFEEQHLKRITAVSDDAIAAISELPTIDVGESLRQLSETDHTDPGDSSVGNRL